MTFVATVGFDVSVSAVFVNLGVSGAITFTVELDFYDPFPETSEGLIRPFELLSLGTTPLDWFEITLTIEISLSVYVEVGEYRVATLPCCFQKPIVLTSLILLLCQDFSLVSSRWWCSGKHVPVPKRKLEVATRC